MYVRVYLCFSVFHWFGGKCSRITARAQPTAEQRKGLGSIHDSNHGHFAVSIHQDTPFFAAGETELRGGWPAELPVAEAEEQLRGIEQDLGGVPLHRISFSAMWYLRESTIGSTDHHVCVAVWFCCLPMSWRAHGGV